MATARVCSVSGLVVMKALSQLQISVVSMNSMVISVSSKHIFITQTSSMNIAESVERVFDDREGDDVDRDGDGEG